MKPRSEDEVRAEINKLRELISTVSEGSRDDVYVQIDTLLNKRGLKELGAITRCDVREKALRAYRWQRGDKRLLAPSAHYGAPTEPVLVRSTVGAPRVIPTTTIDKQRERILKAMVIQAHPELRNRTLVIVGPDAFLGEYNAVEAPAGHVLVEMRKRGKTPVIAIVPDVVNGAGSTALNDFLGYRIKEYGGMHMVVDNCDQPMIGFSADGYKTRAAAKGAITTFVKQQQKGSK